MHLSRAKFEYASQPMLLALFSVRFLGLGIGRGVARNNVENNSAGCRGRQELEEKE